MGWFDLSNNPFSISYHFSEFVSCALYIVVLLHLFFTFLFIDPLQVFRAIFLVKGGSVRLIFLLLFLVF